MKDLSPKIESRLRELDPAIELIALESLGRGALRLLVDHPGGVDLGLCERVTRGLGELLGEYSVEVSSPGLDRPLTKLDHYRRFRGSRIKIRTRDQIEGRRNFCGVLVDADEASIHLESESGRFEIPFAAVRRSNLIPDLSEVA